MADDKNSLAGPAFEKLPTELLVEIFEHARPSNVEYAGRMHNYFYPVALAQVCKGWRTTVFGTPTLWANIRITGKHGLKQIEAMVHNYLERSKTCPLSITGFLDDISFLEGVIDCLIKPCAGRIQRFASVTDGPPDITPTLLTAIESLDFPILRDVEIYSKRPCPFPFKHTFGRSSPLLRRCRLSRTPLLPSLPSNLVILDYYTLEEFEPHNHYIDDLLEFLPHAAHSLEHLRFRPPTIRTLPMPDRPKIILQNLKSLLIEGSHFIMGHMFVPNLTYFAGIDISSGITNVDEMFDDFSAPKLQSIRFYNVSLRPLLARHDLPSIFPQLESVVLVNCTDESAFIRLLEPHKPEEPPSLEKGSEHRLKTKNPFSELKELAISDTQNWTSLQAVIERRLENGDKSLKKILLPRKRKFVSDPDTPVQHPTQWLPERGIEFAQYKVGNALKTVMTVPPEIRNDFRGGRIYSYFLWPH